mmetsp:Transcript_38915/g.90109  ORF Transcript_38915/g.90109 Transcript_38915/m.90109 type:complete len:278 (-) Transcript_38915:1003-1836(-)
MVAMVNLVHLLGCARIIIQKALSMGTAESHLEATLGLPVGGDHQDAAHDVLIQAKPSRQIPQAAWKWRCRVQQKRHWSDAVRNKQGRKRICLCMADHALPSHCLERVLKALCLNSALASRGPWRRLLFALQFRTFHIVVLKAESGTAVEDVCHSWVCFLRMRLLQRGRATNQIEHILRINDMRRTGKVPLAPDLPFSQVSILQAFAGVAGENGLQMRTVLLAMPFVVLRELLAAAQDARQRRVHDVRCSPKVPLAPAVTLRVLVLCAVASKTSEHSG